MGCNGSPKIEIWKTRIIIITILLLHRKKSIGIQKSIGIIIITKNKRQCPNINIITTAPLLLPSHLASSPPPPPPYHQPTPICNITTTSSTAAAADGIRKAKFDYLSLPNPSRSIFSDMVSVLYWTLSSFESPPI